MSFFLTLGTPWTLLLTQIKREGVLFIHSFLPFLLEILYADIHLFRPDAADAPTALWDAHIC